MNRSQANAHPRVVIVGAGFAGLRVASELSDAGAEVILIDRNNYHKFQPLLYQVATAGLEPDEIVHSVRDIFKKDKNVGFLLGNVHAIDRDQRRVILEDGPPISYDVLVLAAGATTNFFGIPGADEHAFPMKSVPEALHLRNHILRQFEEAERDPDHLEDGALQFVVVGGGPTGVETAGQLSELFRYVIREDYRNVDTSHARVILLEMLPELLMPYAESLRDYTRRSLEKRGVEVRTETTVERVEHDAVFLEGGDRIPTRTLIWAAGVSASPLAAAVGTEQTGGGRLVVGPDLSVPGHPEIYVIGDMCGGKNEDGEMYAQLATVAIQQGRHVGRQIKRRIKMQESQSFDYKDPGIMATIGRNAAVAQLAGGIEVKGFVAWLMWAFIHIYKLVGFRNRFDVFLSWVYNYATYNFSARVIMDLLPAPEEVGGSQVSAEEHPDAVEHLPGT